MIDNNIPKCLIGAHTSASGGAWNALLEGEKIGATTIQFFTANQRQWHPKALTEDAITQFHQTKEQTKLSHFMSHASYLLNLGTPNPVNLEKSQRAFEEEIHRCRALGISYLNFHPGAALDGTREECLDRIVDNLLACQELLPDNNLRLLLEMTAGQGSTVGCRFEELAYIVSRTANHVPVGVCLDTCHMFAAGYDIRTAEAWEETLAQFDDTIGLKHLYAFHLNDSLHPLASRKDRHAPLGKGYIGMGSFNYLMRSPHTAHLPKYLETPGGPTLWQEEIAHLQQQFRNAH